MPSPAASPPPPSPGLVPTGRRLQQTLTPGANPGLRVQPGSMHISVNGSFTGLKPDTYYLVHMVPEDRNLPAPNHMTTSQQWIVHTDEYRPPFCAVRCGASTASSISVTASLDEEGTFFYSLHHNDSYTVPTVDQVRCRWY